MTRELAINLLRQGNNGEQLLQILDTVVDEITEQNVDDAAQHFAAISMPTLESVEF
jgi:CRISPR/Cas system CSM-associated protein Csm2 small subunit